ncbi:iron(III)-transport ATP-binding protein [Arthrobacter sp. PAMC 25486]|uniref:ABC transporter ATP-binding protein n=1 Tax=Arthrobacter sp. PAMC 25486 TaxID=1494608 RepID=UPI000535AA61|nr:ABC transporter ATP-binding protein [Arthrobacter sp. PAMC 25486]AIY02735.1 iron(III)-transport ATP-binding protein [Arthrobacter sp. PAMC 25486]
MDNLTAAEPISAPVDTAEFSPAHESGHVTLAALTKRYGNRADDPIAVNAVDLQIKAGEFVTLLGPSGCGKTSTLRMIAGFETPSSGQVSVDGVDMVTVAPNKRPMSMVFQSYALFPHLSVRQNVAYGLRLKKTSEKRLREEVDTALTIMNLMPYAERAPHQLSGGQQQRVALARALVMRPKVLLFDEPLSNLDAKLRVQMRNEIRRLQKRLGITSIFVTHDQDEAMTLSDRIVVMNQGRIEQIDVPERVYRRPSSIFVADFIGRANFLDATLLTDPHQGRARVFALGRERDVEVHEDVTLDGEVLLMVRPESVLLTPNPAADSVHGEVGRVLSAIFHGESVEYEVETDSGSIVALVSDPSVSEIFDPMDTVSVGIKTDRGWLLPVAVEA